MDVEWVFESDKDAVSGASKDFYRLPQEKSGKVRFIKFTFWVFIK
jgi:hypothetical protein